MVTETANAHVLVDLLFAEPSTPRGTLPLRVMLKPGKNLDLVPPLGQSTGQTCRVRGNTRWLGRVIDSEDRDFDRSLVRGYRE